MLASSMSIDFTQGRQRRFHAKAQRKRKDAKKSDVSGTLIYPFICGFASAEGRCAALRET